MNMIMYFLEHNIPIKEIKIQTIYENSNKQSNFRALKDSIEIYKIIKNGGIK